jgi:hypothetical protein
MVYDEARDRMVVFGGSQGATKYGDTWEWTGSGWVNACTDPACQASSPSARVGHAMAYDAKRARTLLFGGYNDTEGALWQWDGTSWSIREPGGPPPQENHAMVFDSARSRTVLFDVSARTWEWDGAHWTEACTGACASALPDVRRFGAMTYDAAHGATLLFGGNNTSNVAVQTTWSWNGAAWEQLCTTDPCDLTLPVARTHHAMAFDSVHGASVMFGGTTASGANGETWTWDGVQWGDACTSTTCLAAPPQARQDHAMAFDAKRGVVVMYGGTDSTGKPLGDTWEWDGESWSERCTTMPCNVSMPPARSGHTLAYDAQRGRIVLFGGTGGTLALDDLWEWDGSAWTKIASEGPVGRFAGAATYDSARDRIVLFGGDDGHGPLGDTWEYHLRGETCVDGSTCDSGSCVDGVCCDATACGTCASCSIGDDAGTCVPITDATDEDTCTGNMTCSSTATCGLANGQPCNTDDECASARCGADPCNRVCI